MKAEPSVPVFDNIISDKNNINLNPMRTPVSPQRVPSQ